ncbi:hypothetical protein [Kribbella sp. CA-294648]|uniref:hypothetical protein n=1 Tax=Kribbella sp. CA-294648 TaxID=3239948 RepID=UPI003D92AC57
MTEQADLHLEIADVIAEVAASLRGPMELEETLRVIVRAAAETVQRIVEARVSRSPAGDGRIETLAPPGPRVTLAGRFHERGILLGLQGYRAVRYAA